MPSPSVVFKPSQFQSNCPGAHILLDAMGIERQLDSSSNGYAHYHSPTLRRLTLASKVIAEHHKLHVLRAGDREVLDGHTLSIASVVAVARYAKVPGLDDSPSTRLRVDRSRAIVDPVVAEKKSVYGITTGLGGSADTRTSDSHALGVATLEMLLSGILPSVARPAANAVLPVLDPYAERSMPEAWVRGAILIRINAFIRGHSAVRWEVMERLIDLLRANITPVVPLRGSVSASGDVSPLSYIAGALMGIPIVHVFDGPPAPYTRNLVPSGEALKSHGIQPLPLEIKEQLAIANGTAFSASLSALVLYDAAHLALLAQVLAALGTEAILGARGSHAPFIHDIARPHPGQIEAARTIWDLLDNSLLASTRDQIVSIDEDVGHLRQDRYSFRSAPQFLGPQLEDIASAIDTLTIECNSTTDNPLLDGDTGDIHHGANFQAMAVTNAMEKTRVALHHIGRLLFVQSTELINPLMNRGLPPNLAATDPSLNYHAKGLDIATAAYLSELGFLANPASTHAQSAEMHNQSINSLALVSARATASSVELLSMLSATYLYVLCQAIDLRAMQAEFGAQLSDIVREEIRIHFADVIRSIPLSSSAIENLHAKVFSRMSSTLQQTTVMDAESRMTAVAGSSTGVIVDALAEHAGAPSLPSLVAFRQAVASRALTSLVRLREEFLSGLRGPAPGSAYLNHTRPVYEFVRLTLGVGMHGEQNRTLFEHGLGSTEPSIGQNVSRIHEAILDGRMHDVVVDLFSDESA